MDENEDKTDADKILDLIEEVEGKLSDAEDEAFTSSDDEEIAYQNGRLDALEWCRSELKAILGIL